MTLDRKDNDGDYCPDNCRWATRQTQSRNRPATKLDERLAHQIRWLSEMGYSRRYVGRAYGVGPKTVRKIAKGEIWKTAV